MEKNKGIGFTFALKGLLFVFREERNFKIHVTIALVAIVMSILLPLTLIEWLFICSVIFLVLVAEVLNSALEALVDYIFPEYHPVAGKVKDMSAGAVLLSSIFAFIVGVMIFFPKLLAIFS
ncbi:diacylglycerol kinase family protein [Salirhabdus salicampi]|uniref:diacylglycerol kinase family protein n=1 Tax=Salirhabdus salicampi TaxID=476102 RepID=UPI0020C3857A|nr:diacylglycerol kinase family protein [Salirhabdus salicampi]MCP8616897.1 diacylglycerol kinase family protein [Salirhabdus salicampi]